MSLRLYLTVGLESHKQSAYLIALASLIKSMPQTTYVHEMPSVSPILNSLHSFIPHSLPAPAVITPGP